MRAALFHTRKNSRSGDSILPRVKPRLAKFSLYLQNCKIKYYYRMDKRFEFKQPQKENWMTDALVIVDKETGVNYLMVRSGYGAGLTPLIDAEGKPIVTK